MSPSARRESGQRAKFHTTANKSQHIFTGIKIGCGPARSPAASNPSSATISARRWRRSPGRGNAARPPSPGGSWRASGASAGPLQFGGFPRAVLLGFGAAGRALEAGLRGAPGPRGGPGFGGRPRPGGRARNRPLLDRDLRAFVRSIPGAALRSSPPSGIGLAFPIRRRGQHRIHKRQTADKA